MVRAVILVLGIGFTHNLYAKPLSLDVSKLHSKYLAENRVLFYLGKHMQSDKVAIWGQTVLTEDIVRVLLESPRNVGQMEELLRSSGNSWAGDYDNYRLYDFILSEPDQSDSFFAQVVKDSSELTPLDGYVDRIEEVDGVTKFFDKDSKEVFPVENEKISKCTMAKEGNACYLFYRSFLDYENLVQILTFREKDLIAYFKENKHLLEGDGILNTKIVDELEFKNGKALGWAISKLKKKLSEDTDHFIHKIVSYQRTVDDMQVRYYRFADTITLQEKELIAYFKDNKHLLEGDGIVNTKIVEELGFKNGQVLGWAIRRLKKALPEDHFIHRIVSDQRIVDGEYVNYYRFTDAITPQEKELIAYFEENKRLLKGDGIINTKIVEELGFKNGQVLGFAIKRLKKTLSEDIDHFIHRVEAKKSTVYNKKLLFYRFVDAITSHAVTPQEKEFIAYLEENKHLLEGDGILNTKIVEDLGFKNGKALGWVISNLKRKLSEDTDNFIHKIVYEQRIVDGEYVNYYRFTDAITPQEKKLIAYLKENKHLLEGDGILNTKIVDELGFKSGIALGHAIGRLKKRLSEDTDHIIHRVVPKVMTVDGEYINAYHFIESITSNAITPREKELIAYLEENMELLRGEGIVNTEIVEELGFKNGQALGHAIGRLKKELSEYTDHFIHKIVHEQRIVDGEYVNYYRFTDAITPQEKKLIAYLKENKHLLEGDGILNTKIVEDLGFKNGKALGWVISNLKRKLSEDTDNFIHKIVSDLRIVDGKKVSYYRFADAITSREKKLIAYLEENMELLRGDGIANTEIIEEFGFKNGQVLGHAIGRLKKKLSEDTDHIIHKIASEQRRVDGEQVSIYRITP